MSEVVIDFEWPIDDGGYRVVTPTRDPGRPTATEVLTGEFHSRPELRPLGGNIRRHRPLEFHPTLFRQFAELGESPDAFAKFASSFGMLFAHERKAEGESVIEWRSQVKKMKSACRLWEQGKRVSFLFYDDFMNTALGQLSVVLRSGHPNGRPILALIPRSLLSAMWLQFAQFVSSDRKVKACEWCGAWFEVGPGGKRADTRFCSDSHKDAFHNAEKAKRAGRLKPRRGTSPKRRTR